MGNCTSKKSGKALKSNLLKKTILNKKMEKDQETVSKGLSKKVAPFTKGEATSFGFKKKPTSSLPIPVTLTSNGHAFQDNEEKKVQNGILKNKDLIDEYQSGSSVESLCHAPIRSTPKMIRKKDLARQNFNSTFGNNNINNNVGNNINNNNNSTATITTVTTTTVNNNNNNNNTTHNNSNSISNSNNNYNNSTQSTNRFGFRQQKSTNETSAKTVKYAANTHVAGSYALSNQGPYDTGTYKINKKPESSTRSRSEGPNAREAFFKQTLQPAGSMQSVLNQSRGTLTNLQQPGKFTLQTSHLPRPQFPLRMQDTKTAKTVTNYYRRGGAQSDSNSSKEGSLNEDSGFESHPSANNTLKRNVNTLDSSPGYGVRKRLPVNGKKLEMKIVGNKFELLKKDEENDPNVVTEVSLIKLPSSGIRTTTAIINTGLVEQRANQYLKRIQNNTKDTNKIVKETPRLLSGNVRPRQIRSDNNQVDEGLGGESEEEKLFKDSKKSEKNSLGFLLSHGNEPDEMLPGEAMVEDISVSLSSDEESSSEIFKKPSPRPIVNNIQTDITPNSIRLDALKLSKQLKCKIQSLSDDSVTNIELKIEDSSLGPLTSCEPDEETFPSDSILEQLSSDSDSLGDKGENKDNDKEKDLKNADIDVDVESEELEIDVDVDVDIDLDVDLEDDKDLKDVKTEDIEELELNIDEKELNDLPNNTLEPHTPESPGTPTNASNSLSLSEGRDFLIDDEIADQPQLCFTETYPDCSCQDDVKTCNDKTLTSSGNNNDFLSCTENTRVPEDGAEAVIKNDENVPAVVEDVVQTSPGNKEKRRNSVGTLSPCESLTSDDLMMDFESSVCDESAERPDSVDNNSMIDIEITTNGEEILREWSSVSSQRSSGGPALTPTNVRRKRHEELEAVILTPPASPRPPLRLRMGSGKLLKSRGGSGNSTPGSPRSIDMLSKGVSSPMRSTSRPSTADDDSVKIDKISYQHMFQDIVSIKTMLLKLKRVLSESEGNLYENGLKLYQDEGSSENGAGDELSDLRRQVTFLQQQLEERERLVQNLQLEINKNSDGTKINGVHDVIREQCNAATQTDRVRPVSTGPSILQNLPSDSGSLVSHNSNNSKPNRNHSKGKNETTNQEKNTKNFVTVKTSTPQMEKIMEKVKELSFKPVSVLEKEDESQQFLSNGCQSLPRCKYTVRTSNGLFSTNPNTIVDENDLKKPEPCRKPSKNVFKITKIDLVLKSDNYGKSDINNSKR